MALTDEDMNNLSIDFSEKLDLNNCNSKTAINQIVNLTNKYLGIKTKDKKILIEAVPNESGCIIFISFLPYSDKFIK